jgi:acyl-CoA synthetase (NDP forming)
MGKKTLGLAKICSIGNRSDVEETEVLEYLLKDPATQVIALYLESFIHGRRFHELALSSEKPIVVLKGGKTPLGAEASASHTASLASNNELVRGVLRQAGVHQADDFFEMVDIARTLEKDFRLQQSPEGKARIAILSYSGAAGIVTTDHLVANGLTLARLSPKTLKRLEELSPPWMPVRNPVDYWPAAERHGPLLAYKHGIEALHEAPEVDGVIVHLFAGFGIWFLDMKEIMSGIKEPRKPILFWLIGPEKGREPTRMTLEREGWPTFHEIHRTVKVMANLFEELKRKNKRSETPFSNFPVLPSLKCGPTGKVRGALLNAPVGRHPGQTLAHSSTAKGRACTPESVTARRRGLLLPGELTRQAGSWAEGSGLPENLFGQHLCLQADEEGQRILDEHEAKKWLAALDLNVVKEVAIKEVDEAIRAAEKMGFPVVLKGRVEGKIHKTEAGLVKLNLWNSDQIKWACHEMLNINPKPHSFLVQPMLKGDLELIVGITRDPQFGPAVMLGLGGIHAEVYRDVIFHLPPLNPKDVFEMVSELKGQALFRGYRGSKPVDMRDLADWLVKLGWLAMNFDKIQEIDVNPLLIVDGKPVAVDATMILG